MAFPTPPRKLGSSPVQRAEGGVRRNLSPGPPGEMGRGDGARGGAENSHKQTTAHLSADPRSTTQYPVSGACQRHRCPRTAQGGASRFTYARCGERPRSLRRGSGDSQSTARTAPRPTRPMTRETLLLSYCPIRTSYYGFATPHPAEIRSAVKRPEAAGYWSSADRSEPAAFALLDRL